MCFVLSRCNYVAAFFILIMGKVRDMAAKLNSFNIMRELDLILLELTDVITGMNKEQLSIGKDARNDTLMDYASEFYAGFKVDIVRSKAPLGTPDLKLTGDFYSGFQIIIKPDTVVITSTDNKTLLLEGKYGDIFGLTNDKITELSMRYILPRLQTKIKQILL